VCKQADIYERITARIIEQMEKTSAASWQKPWITSGQNTLQPGYAAISLESRGVNVLMLWAAAEITGYQAGRWRSFKQWQQLGAKVCRGEKGTPVVFYSDRNGEGAKGVGGASPSQRRGVAQGTPIRHPTTLWFSVAFATQPHAHVRGSRPVDDRHLQRPVHPDLGQPGPAIAGQPGCPLATAPPTRP